ncbi:hypothetical protein Hdeb2414_s0560g00916691 [Helianthus debilis subsp. tardiflorus]
MCWLHLELWTVYCYLLDVLSMMHTPFGMLFMLVILSSHNHISGGGNAFRKLTLSCRLRWVCVYVCEGMS